MAAQAEAWLPAVEETARLPGIDATTWLSAGEMAQLRDAAPTLAAACGELAAFAVPATLVHGDLHLSNVTDGPAGYRYFDWTDACISHPFVDLLAFFHEDEEEVEGGLRTRLRDAYLAEWTSFEPPGRLLRAWRLAEPVAAFHYALSYRSIAAGIEPPLDRHMAASTAYWLRKVLAGLATLRDAEPASPVGGPPEPHHRPLPHHLEKPGRAGPPMLGDILATGHGDADAPDDRRDRDPDPPLPRGVRRTRGAALDCAVRRGVQARLPPRPLAPCGG